MQGDSNHSDNISITAFHKRQLKGEVNGYAYHTNVQTKNTFAARLACALKSISSLAHQCLYVPFTQLKHFYAAVDVKNVD